MIRVCVTNEDSHSRRWNVEPYGDDVTLLPKDSLTVEVEEGPDVLIEIGLHAANAGEVLWMYVNGQPVLASDLKLNNRSLWPPR